MHLEFTDEMVNDMIYQEQNSLKTMNVCILFKGIVDFFKNTLAIQFLATSLTRILILELKRYVYQHVLHLNCESISGDSQQILL